MAGGWTLEVSLKDDTDATSYTTSAFTSGQGGVGACLVVTSDSVETGTVSDSLGGSWDFVASRLLASSTGHAKIFVRSTLIPTSSMTVTFSCPNDQATSCLIAVMSDITVTRLGLAAVRQVGGQDNIAASTTPAPTFSLSPLTTNSCLGLIGSNKTTAMVPPTLWTEALEDATASSKYSIFVAGRGFLFIQI